MEEVAETLVAAFCRAAGIGGRKLEPPVEVFEIASRIGATTVDEESLAEDGRVEDGHRTTLILLRTATKGERRRFTLAHELGHLVFADPEVLNLARETLGVERFDVERMCNYFAAELLMPRRWLREQFEDRPERLTVLEELAQRAEVSVSAAANRLRSALGWSSTLLYFQRRRDWEPVVIAAGALGRKRLVLTRETAPVLRTVPICEPEQIFVRALQIEVAGRPIDTRVELRATVGGVLCFTRFRPVRREAPASQSH
jgi:hypothetical protein